MSKKILPVKNDVIFRLFFADERNVDFLKSFLKSVLKLPDEDYNEITIIDPHLLPEYTGDKLSVIDVKLRTKSGKIVHIEIQLKVTPEMKNRIIFYDAKLITEQLGKSERYETIQQVISIIITEEKLIKESAGYHHRFTFYDSSSKIEFSDIIEIYTLELGKLPDLADGTQLYDWAKLIAAETEEELNMIAERNPEVKPATVKILELSGDELVRDRYERQLKAERDLNMWKRFMESEGWAKGEAEGRTKGEAEGRAEEAKKWQAALADKDAEIARLRAELEARQSSRK